MRSHRRAAVALSLVLLTTASCGSHGEGRSPAPPAASDPSAAPTTTAAPGRRSCWKTPAPSRGRACSSASPPAPGVKVAMVNKIGLELTVDGTKLPSGVVPATKTVMEQVADRVDLDGTLHYSVTFVEVSVQATPGADPAVVSQTQGAFKQLEGLRGRGVGTPSGESREFSNRPGAQVDRWSQ